MLSAAHLSEIEREIEAIRQRLAKGRERHTISDTTEHWDYEQVTAFRSRDDINMIAECDGVGVGYQVWPQDDSTEKVFIIEYPVSGCGPHPGYEVRTASTYMAALRWIADEVEREVI